LATLSPEKSEIKFLLLEGVHQTAVDHLKAEGYSHIEYHKGVLDKLSLKAAIRDTHFIGIRSRTELCEDIFASAEKLISVGCFCIGTNHVDLNAAAKKGIPIFNAPFSNTRSVAEMALGELFIILRGIPAANAKAHRGEWYKQSSSSYEVRGKKLGIIGYGRIGMQLGILAESVGLQVFFYDIEQKLRVGNAQQVSDLRDLLNISDVISLHVPETAMTENMISDKELAQMKRGSLLINTSRGKVVNIDALYNVLKNQHLAGAAIDVFPEEPSSRDEPFQSKLREFDNVILTPHIAGSTEEAQKNIGDEVAVKLMKYYDNGSTLSSVNFPKVSLPYHRKNTHRLLHIYQNRPGILNQINQIFFEQKIKISNQYLKTNAQVGYVVIDVETQISDKIKETARLMQEIDGTIKLRLLF